MDGMAIGEVARRAGLEPSAIRYYESLGLLPEPPRVGGKRRYDPSVLEWLSLIALAREAGFTMAEIKRLVTGFTPGTRPAARWEELATRKLAEIDALVARAERMRAVLRVALDCGCFRLDDCRALLDAGPVDGRSPCVLPSAARQTGGRTAGLPAGASVDA
jgi:MerR family redox-sensitive transcriptional activator SoxR